MQRVKLADVELAVYDQGQGPPLVFVHGFPLDHTQWRGQLEEFSATRRVLAPDLRGFGQSGVTERTVTMEDFADDIAGMLDALGVSEPVALCGLSMGGYIAFQFARKYRDRLNRLILCDTRANADSPEAAEGRRKMAQEVHEVGAELVAKAMMPKLFAPETSERQPELVASVRDTIGRTSPWGIAAALQGMAVRPDSSELLETLSLPTLVVVGQHDAISPPDVMREIAHDIRGAGFSIIPDAGHLAPLENPAAFNELLGDFLAR